MDLNNGNNFYLIDNDWIYFWGLDLDSQKTPISTSIRQFITVNNFSINEVCEFNQHEDFELFIKACDVSQNTIK
jgi:hypothetical protein